MSSIIARSRAVLTFLPVDSLVEGDGYRAYANDGAGGAIDYGSPLNRRPVPAWPPGERNTGRGNWARGMEARGFGPARLGRGSGARGLSLRGFDDDARTFATGLLDDGDYELAIKAVAAAGNESAAQTAEVALAAEPAAPTNLAAETFDGGTDTLSLSWTLSEDDG